MHVRYSLQGIVYYMKSKILQLMKNNRLHIVFYFTTYTAHNVLQVISCRILRNKHLRTNKFEMAKYHLLLRCNSSE